MNDLARSLALFADFEPFAGYVPKGFLVDFLGCLTDATFRTMWGVDPSREGGGFVATQCPSVSSGESFFEAADWFAAALDARGSYTMITLGALYGGQAVGAFRALRRLNPMPAKLVAVEPDPENFAWMQKHFRDNDINPRRHWLLNCALSDSNQPVLFPVGAPGAGGNNCFSTNHASTRLSYAQYLREDPNLADRVANLILEGDTGIELDLAAGYDFRARVKFISAVTLADVLGPFDRVDLLESDIQQSEVVVFPPAMDVVKAKVKRVHLGTHGIEAHDMLRQAFASRRFEIVFDYPPDKEYETPWGSFHVGDGIISARNLDL